MSYTTQKQFLSIAFPTEGPKLPNRKRSDAVLKSYSSCYDYRAWSRDGLKQSQFIEDVANRTISQAAKVPLYSFSGAELTKEILVRLDADNLADYILSLRDDVKKKHNSIESLEQAKTELVRKTETLDENLKALDEENRQLRAEIERIVACQEQQRETAEFDEQELFEISQMIIDLRDHNKELEEEMTDLREELKALQTTVTTESPIGDSRAIVEAENNFLKFKAKDYDRLESELALFKAEYENLTQQKRELAEEVQRAQQYRLRMVELKQNLKEELHRREVCEEQIEMLVNMYEQQSVELHQLKAQAHTLDRSSRDRLFDESTDDQYGSQTTITEMTVENTRVNTENPEGVEDRHGVDEDSYLKESGACSNCARNLEQIQKLNLKIQEQKQHIEELNENIKDQTQHIEGLKQQAQSQQQNQATSEMKTISTDSTVQQQQIIDLRQELAECQRQFEETTEMYATLRETSMADCKELGRLKLQLEQLTSDSPSDATVGQLELLAANEKLNNLQEENEQLRADLTKNKALVVELETKVQSLPSFPIQAGGGVAECCVEKAGKITELEQIISGLKDVSSKAEGVTSSTGEENAKLVQRIDTLEKELQERDQKLKTLQETTLVQSGGSLQNTPGEAGVDSTPMDALLSQLAEKSALIEQLQEKLKSMDESAAPGDDVRACQEELTKLRARLAACEEDTIDNVSKESRKTVRISDEVEQFEPLSVKEELDREQEEKETEEIKPEREEDDENNAYNDADDENDAYDDDATMKKQDSSLGKLEELQNNLSKRHSMKARRSTSGMLGSGLRDCDCIQAIAFKIAQGGLELLLVAELYVLLQEICGAITRKNAVLGRNVTVLANSMTKCWQVITDARVMMNMELTDRTNHQSVVQSVESMNVPAEDNRSRTASHMGHLTRPSLWPGMLDTKPLIPVYKSLSSVRSDDNRRSKMGSVEVDRRRTIKWMENMKKSCR
ncbi:myosin-11-like [Anopheles maculipalpis]|uniref:myosin-11-like n=1 Tax=Anopheles maculipalpis TaxID=1496333 RepID=UPI0021590FEB|nr:myosin-11-like [Anopheles maculipalpis]